MNFFPPLERLFSFKCMKKSVADSSGTSCASSDTMPIEDNLSSEKRFEKLVCIGHTLVPKYRFKWPQMSWWDDEDFNHYLERFGEDQGFNTDRRWNLAEAMKLCWDVMGDTVECGSYKGAGSYLICKLNLKTNANRLHHIFDSFEGVSEPSNCDGSYWKKGLMATTETELIENLHDFDGHFKTYKGWIPERFSEVAHLKFAFIHIDVDLFEPTRDSLSFFYDRLQPGGVLLCDDYGFTTCPGATRAVDEFLSNKPEHMFAFASGGGFFIKK